MSQPPELRYEPWPGATGVDMACRPFVRVARLQMRSEVRVASSGRSGYRTLLRARESELWELPLEAEPLEIRDQLEITDGGRATRHPLPGLAIGTQGGVLGRAESADAAAAWEALLAHHVEHACRWSEAEAETPAVLQAEGATQVRWSDFLEDYWNLGDAHGEPPRHLIVRIAQDCAEWVHEMCQRPRRILRRVRRMVPLARAQDIDDACMRWLTRQPGRGLAERAGPRQSLLAVAREESLDTPENRVLRDFLRLCTEAARRYLQQYAAFADSQRLQDVRRYLRGVTQLLRQSPIAEVPPLVGAAHRNYVLQFDPRYEKLWQWYQRLRRQEDDRDDLRPWRHRTWAEYCELLIIHQCEKLQVEAGSFASPVVLHSNEADHGRFVDPRTRPGPWALASARTDELLRFVRSCNISDHPSEDISKLAGVAPDAVLALGPVFAEAPIRRLLGIWTMFSPDDTDAHASQRTRRLDAALQAHGHADVAGVLILPECSGATPLQRIGRILCLRAELPVPGALESTRQHVRDELRSFVCGSMA